MDASCSAEEHFRRGEAALQSEDHARALEHFRAANRLDPTSPRYRSYFGLCLGLAERRFDKALDLCRSAAKEEFFNPALYHNLALVHLAFGFKAEVRICVNRNIYVLIVAKGLICSAWIHAGPTM